jgi:RimJ/RimL family protein N-acetyltransferase
MPAIALPDPPLSDGVIVLRGFRSTDVAALVEACQDPEIPRFTLVPSPYTEDHARAWLRRVAVGRASGTRMTFAIVDASAGAPLLGAAGLNVIDRDQSAADVGYWVAAPARGRGVATRAVELVAAWAFDTLGLARLELRAQAHNHASRAVAGRAGFVPVQAPLVRRPECDHLPDVFYARLSPETTR